MNTKIINAEKRVTKAKENLKNIIKDVQAKCKHPKEFVHEADWQPETTFFNAQPPFLVCTKCGLAETGWGIGYHTLPETGTKLIREKAMEYVKRTISEIEKCERKYPKYPKYP